MSLPENNLIAMLRAGENSPGGWGIFSTGNNLWIDVVFATESEANEAIDILRLRPSKHSIANRPLWLRRGRNEDDS